MPSFHSAVFSNFPGPGLANYGDIWFATDQGRTYWSDLSGNLHDLLVAAPYPTLGPPGIQGPKGETGETAFSTLQYMGNWVSTTEYPQGAIVTFNNFLYLANTRNVANAPESNPFWSVLGPSSLERPSVVIVIADGGTASPASGIKGNFSLPFNAAITGWTLFGDAIGSAVFDVLWTNFAGYPSAVSIVGSSNPSLATEQKAENLDVSSDWSPVSFLAGDLLQFNLLSCSTEIKMLTLTLNLAATN